MPIIHLEDAHREEFELGRTYQTLVGDDAGSTPIRVGIQTSPPGYSTGTHAHPYMEVVTVIEGTGEAWIGDEENAAADRPGLDHRRPGRIRRMASAIPARRLMRTYGVHASPVRIVHRGK